MAVDPRKLFIGGISWDTNEDDLREHFSKFGEVAEVVIMKDRNTGRARGFGFVVFTHPAVSERVVMEKHAIDGRIVDVKKAVPREDQQILNRSNNNSICGSLSPGRTRKIFVGGLPPTITENDFKNYFDQFGTITDAVVMYDHNTQRPRGFGFITYDSEDAVNKVLLNSFHDLNGKKVEVKRAVPKELSPGPNTRLQTDGYNYGVNGGNSLLSGCTQEGNSFLSGYTQGNNPSLFSGYGMKMDAKLRALSAWRNGLSSLVSGFRVGIDYDPTLSSSILGNANLNSILKYQQELNSYCDRNLNRYNSPMPYSSINQNTGTLLSLLPQNVLGNTELNYTVNSTTASASMASGRENLGSFSNSRLNWASSLPISSQIEGSFSGFWGGNVSCVGTDNTVLGGSNFERSVSPPAANTNRTTSCFKYEASYENLYRDDSVFGDPTWQLSFLDLDVTSSLSYRLGNPDLDITGKEIEDFACGYFAKNKQTYAES
ncbi:heterogeneous nuclear ribonucleoprotein A0-like [Zingiber officinale]|uniref:heterogeneous nuclear ribonucleoprotein A0-like n=1 Tax=Zingiber officinale TaxID=94328 RepID=UPI001C4B62B3|nr:heterogeneous nuclear ribonucleoprotein A0-like [Zingiber officinale]